MKFICLNYLLATAFFATMFLSGRPIPSSDRPAIGYQYFIKECQKSPSYPKWSRITCYSFYPDIFVIDVMAHGSCIENNSKYQQPFADSVSSYLRGAIYNLYISQTTPIVEYKEPKLHSEKKRYPLIKVEYVINNESHTIITPVLETNDSIIIHTPEFEAFYKTICDLCHNYYKQNNSHISFERIGCPG